VPAQSAQNHDSEVIEVIEPHATVFKISAVIAAFLLVGLSIFYSTRISADVDTDGDGFSDSLENFIGTDSNDACPDNSNDPAWPADFNNDKTVSSADTDAINPYFLSQDGDGRYKRRYDLNADAKINILDVGILRPNWGKTCTNQIDLIIQSGSLSFSPANPTEGNQMTFSGTVKNQGTDAAGGSSYAKLRIDIGNNGNWDKFGTNQSTAALAAGATEIEIWSNAWTATGGTHKFEICADFFSVIAESDEGNNCASKTFTVSSITATPTPTPSPTPTPTSKPDLVPMSPSLSPTSPAVASSVFFTGRVKNSGTADAGSYSARFCVDNSNCPNSLAGAINDFSMPTISAGSTSSAVTTSNPWIATLGSHTVYWCADIYNRISESNESNNCASLTFNVAPAPSCSAPQPFGPPTISPNPVGPGQGATVTASGFSNCSSADKLTYVIWIDGQWVSYGNRTLDASSSFLIPFTAPSQPGTYQSRLQLDKGSNGSVDVESATVFLTVNLPCSGTSILSLSPNPVEGPGQTVFAHISGMTNCAGKATANLWTWQIWENPLVKEQLGTCVFTNDSFCDTSFTAPPAGGRFTIEADIDIDNNNTVDQWATYVLGVKPAPPAGLSASCSGTTLSFSWNASRGTVAYWVRINDLADGWIGPLDTVDDNVLSTSYTRGGAAGHTYTWWVHAVNEVGWSVGADGPSVTCAQLSYPHDQAGFRAYSHDQKFNVDVFIRNWGWDNLGKFLYGLAGCESTWNEKATGTYQGLHQYLWSTWNSSNTARLGSIPDIYDGFIQMDNTAWIITSGWSTIGQQWPGCTDGGGREWTQFITDW